MVTLYPLACSSLPNEEAMIPFPNEDITPPVTNIYFVLATILRFIFSDSKKKAQKYEKYFERQPVARSD